jgi:hypothetical protein
MNPMPDLETLSRASMARARSLAAEPLVRRSHRLADIPPELLDSRATERLAERQEIFALAMSDFFAASRIAAVLPEVARAAVEQRNETLAARVVAQLEETASWSPLQRPGWTLFQPGDPPTPGYEDGNWLATGVAMWAVTEAARSLEEGGLALPRPLDARLRSLVRDEIAAVYRDYREQVPWFAKGNGSPACNQWVLPLCAVVEGAAWLGTARGEHAGPYEAAVANLNRSLDTQGTDGDFVEGLSYALFTMTHWLRASRAALRAGDRRLAEHPYLRAFPRWMAQMFLPGGWTVNACDCGITRVSAALEDERRLELAELPSLAAVTCHSPEAAWLLREYLGPSCTAAGLEAARALPPVAEPPRWGAMRSLGVAVWRTGWGASDHAVWIRTSGGLPSHTHADSAHVSLYRHGRPVLIEAGTPSYGHPDIARSFASGAGHSVLQLGTEWPEPYMEERAIPGWLVRDTPVSVVGMRLGEDGGEATLDVDPSGYAGAKSWRRSIRWDREALLRVVDAVELTSPAPILFRWHLGSADPVEIEGSGGTSVTARQGRTTVRLRADRAIRVEAGAWPGPDEVVGPHRCLVVRTAGAGSSLALTTEVS